MSETARELLARLERDAGLPEGRLSRDLLAQFGDAPEGTGLEALDGSELEALRQSFLGHLALIRLERSGSEDRVYSESEEGAALAALANDIGTISLLSESSRAEVMALCGCDPFPTDEIVRDGQ